MFRRFSMEGKNVPCPTKKQDGNLCGCPLFPQFNLCPICGVQVDQTLFKTGKQTFAFDENRN